MFILVTKWHLILQNIFSYGSSEGYIWCNSCWGLSQGCAFHFIGSAQDGFYFNTRVSGHLIFKPLGTFLFKIISASAVLTNQQCLFFMVFVVGDCWTTQSRRQRFLMLIQEGGRGFFIFQNLRSVKSAKERCTSSSSFGSERSCLQYEKSWDQVLL